MEEDKKLTWLTWPIIIVVIAVIAVAVYWYMRGRQPKEALPQGLEVPQLQFQTNPIEELPEVNPVEKTNPFKYENPLR